MAAFPDTLTCVIVSGYSQSVPQNTVCLIGNTKTIYKPVVDAKIVIDSASKANDYSYWWINTISHGMDEFTIELPLMGVTRDWTVIATEGFTSSVKSNNFRELPLKMEIQDDIADYLPTTTYGLTFPTELGCVNVEGYSEKSAVVVKGLCGVNKVIGNERLTAKVTLDSDLKLSKFAAWYVNELEYGTKEFTLTVPFMGKTASWGVKFTNSLVDSLIFRTVSTVSMELEMMDYSPPIEYIECDAIINRYSFIDCKNSDWVDDAYDNWVDEYSEHWTT